MARNKRIFLLLPLLALACLVPSVLSAVQPQTMATPAPQAQPEGSAPQIAALVTADPNATPTPTPFLPTSGAQLPLTTTEVVEAPDLTSGPPWGTYPAPSVNPAIEIPPPVGLLPQPPGQVNIVLLGSDQRPNEGGFRTDTIILLTVNPEAGTATMTSFPRDLYVYIPGWTMQRINTAQQHGGFPLTQLTFEYNFGVRPDKFVMVNFWGFKQMINSLGGIYVNAARSLTDHRDRYGYYTVPAGTVYMDGDTALWYARSRYSTSDFDRTRRQQEVILGIFNRLLSLDAIQQAPDLYEIYRQNVTMNLSFDDIQPFLPLAAQIGETDSIRNYYISSDNVIHWRTPGGAAVLLPEREEVLEIMKLALSVPE
jgi:LCP family protein required for cell wall assembly